MTTEPSDSAQEPEEVVLVQCTNEKRDGTHRARDLYDESTYFRKQRSYAETADVWYIQSAKYGLVHPEWEINSYDESASDLEDPDDWARDIALDLDDRIPDDSIIKVLGGQSYSGPLVPHLETMGYEVHTPFAGLRIGERMAKLEQAANSKLEGFA